MTNIIEQCEYIAIQAQKSTLDRLAHLFGLDHYEQDGPQRYKIYDGVDRAYDCRYCGENDLWIERGGVFRCHHQGSYFRSLMPLEPVPDVREMSEVSRWEEV